MKRNLFLLIISIWFCPLFSIESTSSKSKKTIRFKEEPLLKAIKPIPARTAAVKAAANAHVDLQDQLNDALYAIKTRLEGIVLETKPGDRVYTPEIIRRVLPNEHQSIIADKCNNLYNALSADLDDITKKNISISLENYVQQLKDTLNDAVHVSKRFGNSEQPSLALRFELDLEEKGLDPFTAYELLGFDKEQRSDLKIEDIKDAYYELEQKYDVLTSAKGRQIFEAYALLSSTFGKELYDEYLLARQQQNPELMDTPPLPLDHIEKLDRDIGSIINELSAYRACLMKLLDKLQANND